MIRNYLLVATRSLRRHAGFTLINVVGLSISMAVGLLLILFVREQASKDKFHEDADRIYRVYSDFKSSVNRDNDLYATAPAQLSSILADEFPGVETSVKLRSGFGGTVTYKGSGLPVSGFYADPAFFDIFSFELSDGNPETALLNPYSIVLNPATAEKFFADANPIGEVLSVDGQGEFTVTGLLDRDNYPSHIPLAAIASYATLESDSATVAMLDDWTRSIYRSYTYIKLEETASASAVQTRIDGLITTTFTERNENRLHGLIMLPLSKISLGPMLGNELGTTIPKGVAFFLSGLALIILLTACFNYVGITVSRSLRRAREVGVRKMLGARRFNVFAQFIVEALVVSTLAVLGATLLLTWLVQGFNSMTFVSMLGATLSVNFGSDPGLYLVLALFTLAIAFIAGLYPAVYLSRFQPARAMKGTGDLSAAGGSRLRKTLVVVQFSLSIVFIVVTTTMFRQSNFMLTADYGFEQENIVNVQMFSVPYPNFKQELASSPNIVQVSGISPLPAMGSRRDRWLRTPEMAEPVKGYAFDIDQHTIENLGLTILAGRDVSPDIASDADRTVLVNETFISWLDLGMPEEAVGKTFIMRDSTLMEVAGVLKDFQADLMMAATTPNLFQYAPDRIQWANIRVVPGQYDEAIVDIRQAWKKMGYTRAIEYERFDLQLKNNFANLLMRDVFRLIGFIAILALVIACLGLLGIATFNVERRIKEISIRKVLGATPGNVVGLLSKEFVVLMGISLTIAIPLAWMLSSSFLSEFARRIDLGVGTFVFSVGFILALAMIVISSQTVRAAWDNPVDHLHDD